MAVKLRRSDDARTVDVDSNRNRNNSNGTAKASSSSSSSSTTTPVSKMASKPATAAVNSSTTNTRKKASATATTTNNTAKTTTTTTSSSTRYASIDVLRALSQTQMILVHFVDFWSGGKWQHKYYEYEIMDVVMWLLLSGVSFHITSSSTMNRYGRGLKQVVDGGIDGDGIQRVRQQSWRRGIFFILLHLFVTLVVIQDTVHAYMCDTLVLLGISQIVLGYVCTWNNTTIVISTGVSILLLTAAVQYDWFWSQYWIFDGEGEYNHNINLETYDLYDKIELTFDMILCNGIFPIFPYLGYPLIGLGLGRLLYPVQNKYQKQEQQSQQKATTKSSSDESVQMAMKYILRIGLFLVTMSASLIIYGKMDPSIVKRTHQWKWLMLDGYGMELGASFEYIWGSLGKDLVWIVLAKRIFDTATTSDGSNVKSTFVSIASQMSRTSLTMYILHHVVIFMVIRGMEWWEDEDFDEYHGDVFAENPMYSIYIGLTFFVGSQYVLSRMEQKKLPMVESLLRWFCKATSFSSSLSSSKITSTSTESKKKTL
mmetsp:Transcript_18877/g.45591  ORF Transcript_18877/g.45591 Transcript_18877/m.45591 type:complete len:540 (+) Transcript_18877:360-1979(+)|eukprot:CAMPEP_0113455480 /NCGR_PEP_ID=MMETSP0014_2-20120614/8398_1 /TAXON_ID=2857 /ORGANISM="Nitzschia sp." /LENGTH=539 /DNA_ID=CAMNT_0000346913 /DNA_START=215 /DNA_END=1834 /DNA_ORIENTATION=+ /assembly_acc=CAM_ASM_000159